MAALEYEVREEYRTYSIDRLLESPVTCFQGVGDTQSEIMERYFGVTTVKQLAEFEPFKQALSVQETVLEGGKVLDQSVDEAAQARQLGFSIRGTDRAKRIVELPEAPVHVLEGLTPGQDLALYDAFRITNLTHLAQNRIMLEARVIDYMSQQGKPGQADPSGTEAVSAILGTRLAATEAAPRGSGGQGGSTDRIQNLASQVTEHVRNRVEAMRDRAQERATAMGEAASSADRAKAISGTRDRGAPAARQTSLERGRSPASSRASEIVAGRGAVGGGRTAAERLESRAAASSSRSDSVVAARQLAGQSGPPAAGSREKPAAGTGTSATPARPAATPARPAATPARSSAPPARPTAAPARPGAERPATPGRPAVAAEAAAEAKTATVLRTEEEATAESALVERRPASNPMPLIAAAALAVAILAGLIWFLVPRGGPDATSTANVTTEQGQPGSAGAEGTPGPGTPGSGAPGSGTPGAMGQPGAAGTQPGAAGSRAAAGAPGSLATATGPGAGPQAPSAMKGTHKVARGDSLWFISQREYADPLNWPSIFIENKDTIRHPDVIYPQQEFRIPANPVYRFPEYPEAYQRQR